LKEGLEKLFELQQLDDKIKEVEISLKQIPEAIKKLEQERDGKATIIENTKAKLNENAKAREKLEKEILLVKEKIKKYRDQMNKATTNKEYQGFTTEIKFEESNISSIEEKVIEKMLESDEIMNEIRESEAEFSKITDDYNKKITDLKAAAEASKAKLEHTKNQIPVLRKEVNPRLLKMYDNIARKSLGKAVSLVETEFCGVCNVGLRPQRLNELLSSKEINFCESCGRILYKKPEVVKEDDKKKN
jgi:uncharacterized protein